MSKKPFHETVAEKLIEQLRQNNAPWQRPWDPGQPNQFLPYNPTTGKRYKGINTLVLMASGYTDQRWMTYRQAENEGAQVRRGEKGTQIQYWKFTDERPVLDQEGKPVKDAEGKAVMKTVKLDRPRMFTATVFNAEQIDGLTFTPRPEYDWNPSERAEAILAASGATIKHSANGGAFYRPSTDTIHMPDRDRFPAADGYYATALHELGHWTGHPSRLDRDLSHPFGSEGYAREELRAEIASMLLGDELGIGHDPGQHVAYVQSWIKALQDDPLEIFRAAADAEKIHDHVLALEQQQIQTTSATLSEATVNRLIDDIAYAVETTEASWSQAAKLGREATDALRSGRYDDALANLQRAAEITAPFGPPAPFAEAATSLQDTLTAAGWKAGQTQEQAPALTQEAMDRIADQIAYAVEMSEENWSRAASLGREAMAALKEGRYEAAEKALEQAVALTKDYDAALWPDALAGLRGELRPSDALTELVSEQGRGVALPVEPEATEAHTAVTAAISHAATTPSQWSNLDAANEAAGHATAASELAQGRHYDQAAARLLQAAELQETYGATNGPTFRDALQTLGRLVEQQQRNTSSRSQEEAMAAQPTIEREIAAAIPAYTELENKLIAADEAWNKAHLAVVDIGTDNSLTTEQKQQALSQAKKDEDLAAQYANAFEKQIENFVQEHPALAAYHVMRTDVARMVKAGEPREEAIKEAMAMASIPVELVEATERVIAANERADQLDQAVLDAVKNPAAFERAAQERAAFYEAREGTAVDTKPVGVPGQGPQQGWLAVPYSDRVAARKADADWDKQAKCWFAPHGVDMSKLAKWIPSRENAPHAGQLTPREEFKQALESLGLVTDWKGGQHPIMDGKPHRVPVEGGKQGALDGFYIGHLDGHPAGRIINNKTGEDVKWKAKGYHLSEGERAELSAQAAQKLAERDKALQSQHERVSERLTAQTKDLTQLTERTPYFRAKGINPGQGVLTDREGQTAFVPLMDTSGKLWSMQYLQADGTKRYAKDSRKEGCFHPVGGLDAVAKAPAIVISEGYATAKSCSDALGFATVAAFDSGNLKAVAKALHEAYPDKPIVIAGDDDKVQEEKNRALLAENPERKRILNPGKEKAIEAANEVGGVAVFPVFASGEAIEHNYTDFNDLATRSSLGVDAVARQLKPAVQTAMDALAASRSQSQGLQQDQQVNVKRGARI